MASRHRTWLLCTCAGAIGIAVTACGSSSSPTPSHNSTPAASATPSPTGPFNPPGGTTPTPAAAPNGTYSVQVSITGTDSVQGSFSQAIVAGSAHCPVPTDLAGTASGQHLEVQMPAATSGIGQPQQLSPGDLQVIVGPHVWGVASASNAPHATSGTLQRNSDGSGSAAFQNLGLQTNPSQQPQESGSITWTCA